MSDDRELSVYELGIIKNSLRERMITIEAFRTDLVTDDEEQEMNERIDAFRLELIVIKNKIRMMISNRADENSSQ
ncbi:hypothetical protein H4W00_002285 [Psychrobacter sp. PL19]|uniref:hypothetical protein n=1 Tax=Psychrobacter sp. PL19 TaxID=2760711 RepID=UPI001AE3E734